MVQRASFDGRRVERVIVVADRCEKVEQDVPRVADGLRLVGGGAGDGHVAVAAVCREEFGGFTCFESGFDRERNLLRRAFNQGASGPLFVTPCQGISFKGKSRSKRGGPESSTPND